MILAAGFGTRLRPYTLKRPKPLFPLLDRPLLLRLIDQLRDHGFSPILVNCHHLKEQIVELLSARKGIVVQQEPMELGTGGGLRMAMDFFGTGPVLVTNGDIYHTIDLAAIFAEHCASGAAATLVVHNAPRFNKIALDAAGRITNFAADSGERWAFTGIQVIDPSLLARIEPGRFANSIDWYRELIAEGVTVRVHVVSGHFWSDMGTPGDYLDLHQTLLANSQSSPFFFGHGVEAADDLQLADWVSIGSGARIGANCRLQRVVVWDNAVVPDHSILCDTIVI